MRERKNSALSSSIVGNKIAETQSAIYDAINKTIIDFDAAQMDLKTELATASYLTDGTKVFLDDDGSVYRQDRQKVAQEDLDLITWVAGSMSWKELNSKVDNISHLHERHENLIGFNAQMTEIGDRYDEIKDDPSKENLAELKLLDAKTEAVFKQVSNSFDAK